MNHAASSLKTHSRRRPKYLRPARPHGETSKPGALVSKSRLLGSGPRRADPLVLAHGPKISIAVVDELEQILF